MSDEVCVYCDEPLLATERRANGVVMTGDGPRHGHVECAIRSVLGGIGHHLDHHLWCVGRKDPDGGLSYRESARQVWDIYRAGPQ